MQNDEIADMRSRTVWSSAGLPALEIELYLNDGRSTRAIAQSGLSGGHTDAAFLKNERCQSLRSQVSNKCKFIDCEIKSSLIGRSASDISSIDNFLSGFWVDNLLSHSETAAISLAIVELSAKSQSTPLWRWLMRYGFKPQIPLPEIEIFGGAAHANYASAVQDIMVIAPGAENYEHALFIGAEIYHRVKEEFNREGRTTGLCEKGGLWPAYDNLEHALVIVTNAIEKTGLRPGKDVGIAIDFAADGFFRYGEYLIDGPNQKPLAPDYYIDYLVSMSQQYPIMSYEDPFAVQDKESYKVLLSRVGHRIQIISDDLLDADPLLIQQPEANTLCNTVMIKPAKAGTVTHTIQALHNARSKNLGSVMAGRSIDSEDVSVMHLSVGLGIGQFKIGSLSRSERSGKFNEGIRIANSAQWLNFASYFELPFKT